MYNILKIDVLLEKETIWEYWRGRSSLVTLDICMFVHMYVCNNSSHLSKSYTVSRRDEKMANVTFIHSFICSFSQTKTREWVQRKDMQNDLKDNCVGSCFCW